MSEFDFWQRWGIDLDDTAFANAWAALGVAAAAGRRRDSPKDTIAKALHAARELEGRLPWAFPLAGGKMASVRREPALVRDTSPEDWAAVGLGAAREPRPRLRIVWAPQGEIVLPWLRLLAESNPASAAVSFDIAAPRAQCEVGWPLRFGFIDEPAESLIAAARGLWPASDLSVPIALGREHANCDVLVYRGTTRTLLKELLDRHTPIKANVVLLQGGEGDEWGNVNSRLAAILTEVRASGYLLIPSGIKDDDFSFALTALVAEISHALPFDVAATSVGRDVIAGFTDKLLEFRLPALAQTYTRRLKSMPTGAEVDLGEPRQWQTRGVRGGETRKAAEPPAVPSSAAADDLESIAVRPVSRVAAHTVIVDAAEMEFEHESDGGSDLAKVATAMEGAVIPRRARRQRAARFLQQRSFIRRGREFRDARHGFLVGTLALVRVRIGPMERKWDSLATAFPVDQLPQHLEQWSLTVWLSEPNHLPEPIKGRIKLPQDGASTECEFRFKPNAIPQFEGRLTVLHRGRVIQTAVLRSSVLAPEADPARGKAPSLEELIPVRHAIGDLKGRRQFDLAFVLNENATGRPLATGLSDKHAWISDLSKSIAIAKDINARLSPVAKSVADYEKGLDGEKGRALLVQLAQLGRYLHLYLVEEQLAATGNRPEVAQSKYLQIVSTKSDAVIPFEFIYEYETPNDDAEVCPQWRKGLTDGECGVSCDRTSGKHVCPMGFWGLQKVIERHALTPELAKEGYEMYLQSETDSASGTLQLGGVGVFGASKRVTAESLVDLTAALDKRTGQAPSQATDWDTWLVAVRDNHPNFLLALAHTDGAGANVSLELGGKTIKSIQVKQQHVRSKGADPRPLVALLGCDTAGTADDYGQHVAVFRARGAAIVIGTIATVFGDHAVQVACRLVEGLLPEGAAPPERLGEALRALKRKALLDNLLMPLCLVAYGDADWKLSRE
jgi:hypothetical protein